MSNFQQASNFVIENLNQTDVRIDLEQQKEKANALLLDEIVQGASHNAGERYDAPKCHPDTRKAILDDIKSWVDNVNEPTRMMWLIGPAGAGKSAIAQTTAESCYTERKLAASFFFSRFVAGRNTKKGLVATIAYQLSVSIPETKEHIIDAIMRNPNIFRDNIKSQVEALIIEPYRLYAERSVTSSRLIIIDGLDECDNADHQAEIINALATSLSLNQASGLRILIASRPEPRIRHAFDDEVVSVICTRLILDAKYNPDDDIELFLQSSFQALKRHHILAQKLRSWPPENSIKKIVQKSSGQFIYAATVMKYISDPQQNPRKRLDIILNITPAGDEKPLAQLDALYTAILSNIRRDYKKVASIFEAIMFHQRPWYGIHDQHRFLLPCFLDRFLLFEEDIELFLADLSSVIDSTSGNAIRFFHASFSDYLQDSSRSHEFYINECQSHARLALCCINYMTARHLENLGHCYFSRYSAVALFEHYWLSNWDENVLESILSTGLLSYDPVNRIVQSSDNIRTLMGYFIDRCSYYQRDIKGRLRNVIDSTFLDHLRKHEPHDIITVYYIAARFKMKKSVPTQKSAPSELGVEELSILVPALNDDTFKHNILFDFVYDSVREWFMNLVQNDLVYFSQDERIKSACYILEMLMCAAIPQDCRSHISERAQKASSVLFSYKKSSNDIPVPFFQLASDLFNNLPVTDEIATAILQKWESLQPNSENLEIASDSSKILYNVLDKAIHSYLVRSLKQYANNKSIQMEMDEHSSTAEDAVQSKGVQTDSEEQPPIAEESLTNYQNTATTGNSTNMIKFHFMLLSVQLLLMAYMYMHFNGTHASSSAM